MVWETHCSRGSTGVTQCMITPRPKKLWLKSRNTTPGPTWNIHEYMITAQCLLMYWITWMKVIVIIKLLIFVTITILLIYLHPHKQFVLFNKKPVIKMCSLLSHNVLLTPAGLWIQPICIHVYNTQYTTSCRLCTVVVTFKSCCVYNTARSHETLIRHSVLHC